MKTLFIIPLHSAADLITNSSSELFVCNTKKTLEAVREMLVELINNHNKLSGENHTFENCFREPTIANYSFDYDKFPEKLRLEYEKYNRTPGNWNINYFGSTENDRYTLQTEDRKIEEKYNLNEKDLYTKNKKEYDRRFKLYKKETNELWFEYRKAAFLAKYNLFLHLIKNGDYQDSQIAKVKRVIKKCINEAKFEIEEWRMRDLKDKQLVDTENNFSIGMSYGIKIEKGNILIHSRDDNSIPWPVQESIESYLGTRYHLG